MRPSLLLLRLAEALLSAGGAEAVGPVQADPDLLEQARLPPDRAERPPVFPA